MAPECAVAKMAQAGKYLSFKLDNEEFGLEILKVQEIVGTSGISPFPRATDNVRGSLNLRGREIPIFWMRDLFGLESWQENEKNCVIIAEVPVSDSPVTIGLVVDEVCEVLNIASEEIHSPCSSRARQRRRDAKRSTAACTWPSSSRSRTKAKEPFSSSTVLATVCSWGRMTPVEGSSRPMRVPRPSRRAPPAASRIS